MKTRLLLPAACLAVLLWIPLLNVFAGSPAPASGEPILIGTIQPMTGPYAAFGVKFYRAYNLAADEINAAGGIKGRPIQIVFEDSQDKLDLAQWKARRRFSWPIPRCSAPI
jgi:ABC-type branched-subunit amino acid transport system substrate-binding protein